MMFMLVAAITCYRGVYSFFLFCFSLFIAQYLYLYVTNLLIQVDNNSNFIELKEIDYNNPIEKR